MTGVLISTGNLGRHPYTGRTLCKDDGRESDTLSISQRMLKMASKTPKARDRPSAGSPLQP
jgi:hypothetical protein